MIDTLGCPVLPNSRGRSLLPLLTDPENTEWNNVAFSEFCQDAAGAGGPFPEEGIFQRMIRSDDWKLNYQHGQPCELFNLEADPRELNNLAADPTYSETAEKLKAKVLNGWDPEWISERMAQLRADRQILALWGRHVRPTDQCRWDLKPEMDYLDDKQIQVYAPFRLLASESYISTSNQTLKPVMVETVVIGRFSGLMMLQFEETIYPERKKLGG